MHDFWMIYWYFYGICFCLRAVSTDFSQSLVYWSMFNVRIWKAFGGRKMKFLILFRWRLPAKSIFVYISLFLLLCLSFFFNFDLICSNHYVGRYDFDKSTFPSWQKNSDSYFCWPHKSFLLRFWIFFSKEDWKMVLISSLGYQFL